MVQTEFHWKFAFVYCVHISLFQETITGPLLELSYPFVSKVMFFQDLCDYW